MSPQRIVLLAFAISVFAVLYAPIPMIDPDQVSILRGVIAPVVGIVFLVVYLAVRRRPPNE
jgi:hypothetical protein